MDFMSPFVSKLSVVTAYVALAFVGKTEGADVFAERSDLERVFRTADAGTGNRADADQFRRLLDRAGLQASDFSLGPPRFALGGLKKSAATAR